MKYNVIASENTEFGMLEDLIIAKDLKLREAIKTAKQSTTEYPDKEIYITWFRATDGQKGFYNPDGNHAINGKAWEVETFMAEDIKNKILEVAKTRKGGNDFIVITDSKQIYGTDADVKNIRFGGGIICILRRDDIINNYPFPEMEWWGWVEDDPCMTDLEEVCKKIEELLN